MMNVAAEITEKYRKIQDYAGKISRIKKMDSFLDIYHEIISAMEFISLHERNYEFGGAPVSSRISEIKSMKTISLKRLFISEYQKEMKRIEKLKTDSGKENAICNFFEKMTEIEDHAFCDFVENFRLSGCDADSVQIEEEPDYIDLVSFAVAYYKNGYLVKVSPMNPHESIDDSRDIAYSAKYIVSDGIKTDLHDPYEIKLLKVPNYSLPVKFPYVVLNMAYILKKQAIRCTNYSIAVELIPKVSELMNGTEQAVQHGISWSYKDYRRLAEQLYAVGAIELAEEFSKRITVIGFPG